MRVNIKTLYNETFSLEVDPEEIMESVRDKIREYFLKPNPYYCIWRFHLFASRSVDYGNKVNFYIFNEG